MNEPQPNKRAKALLFGEPPYVRPGAPEAGLLVFLAAHLSGALLRRALHAVALGPRLPRRSALREDVLKALLGRTGDDPVGFIQNHVPGWDIVLAELADVLPQNAQDKAIAAARSSGPSRSAALILAHIADRIDDHTLAGQLRAEASDALHPETLAEAEERLEAMVPRAGESPDWPRADLSKIGVESAQLLPTLSEEVRADLLWWVVDTIGMRLGGPPDVYGGIIIGGSRPGGIVIGSRDEYEPEAPDASDDDLSSAPADEPEVLPQEPHDISLPADDELPSQPPLDDLDDADEDEEEWEYAPSAPELPPTPATPALESAPPDAHHPDLDYAEHSDPGSDHSFDPDLDYGAPMPAGAGGSRHGGWWKQRRYRLRPAPPGAGRRRGVVNTGFASFDRPRRLRSPHLALRSGCEYWFCVQIGEPLQRGIEPERSALPRDKLPERARLLVELFGFEDELELGRHDSAELILEGDGSASVARPAARALSGHDELGRRRLFFSLRAPGRLGVHRLRCNIYCEGVLVQSRLVRALVTPIPFAWWRALRAKLEYTLSERIEPRSLSAVEPHSLSLMLNGNGNSHTFRVLATDQEHGGEDRIKTDSHFEGPALTDLITTARRALQLASWGSEDEWVNGTRFRYAGVGTPDPESLRADLARLAIAGYNLYTTIIDGLRGTTDEARFEEILAPPGFVQLASPDPRLLVPLAVVYDYAPFDDTASLSKYTLCGDFLEALEQQQPLAHTNCFQGQCSSRGEDLVVCPSGFWGYRHYLGLPLPTAAVTSPITSDSCRLLFGSATELDQVQAHADLLRPHATDFVTGSTRTELMQQLGEQQPHLVYLYCHGGLDRTRPFLQIGAGEDGPLTPAWLYRRINWQAPQPLVVINGCHTTAVRPDQAFEFVSAFIQRAGASGVIGTEITIGEALARAFGEHFVKYLTGGKTVGESVRNARLDLLAGGNPLGLVYTPFVLASLHL